MIFIASEEELQWGHAFSDVEISRMVNFNRYTRY